MIYELRTYYALEGRLDALKERFRDHTIRLFDKHGMKSVAYWEPLDEPLRGKALIYILEHPSREAAAANWKSFIDDPEWIRAKDASEAQAKIVEKIDSVFMEIANLPATLQLSV